ncbi:cysteine-rich RLK (RECEPTOR-like protein kinase) 8 [Striga hermonthica]|uniref:Cysteine-rich RLK (RECEPTOR-like protein kinase) 8 n=1 Tax=Striga hermonthica TaxID=68872 RepID=A0A9N7R494_STRHE|nr:cysteine-rich RLK (RECEPTOR-like protein kinase) 8 [Striga hermonthica]
MKVQGSCTSLTRKLQDYILNRVPTKALKSMTPFEAWHGGQPDVSFLRTFGCICHVKKTKPFLFKLEDRSTPMVFLGYKEGSKAYRLYNPRGGKVVVSRDVVFDEMAAWDWENPGTGEARGVGGTFVIEHLVIHGGGDAGSEKPAADAPSPATVVASVEPQSPAMGTGEESPPAAAHTPPPQSPAAAGQGTPPATIVEFTSPPSNIDEYVDAFHDGEEVRFRRMDNLVGNSVVPGLASRLLDDQELLLVSAEEPSTFAQAERDVSWRRAMLEEMKAIEENETWELIDPPPGCHPIGLKWVYKVKRDESGTIVKHKARLVARGFVQREGIDFDEVFAPVARMESVRLLLAMAAAKDWRIHHLDVKSAFLNGELAETVFVKQAPGFAVKGEEHKVLRLRKALYGLRQAPRAWNAKLDATLVTLGFTRCATEHALYTRRWGKEELVVGVYVDDLIITGAREGDINGFKREMAARFRMSDLGQLSYYLGIEVKQGRDSIILCQRAYAEKLLVRSGMADCKSCTTPMEERLKLTKASTAGKVDATRYRSIVGGLRYLVYTRPNIAFVMGYVSRFMEDHREDHWVAVKRLLRYVKGTVDQGIIFPKTGGGSGLRLTVFSNADMTGDIDGRKSTSDRGAVYVALSTCEAEYVAAATAACQAVWLHRLLSELTGEEARPPALMVDNQPAIALAKNPILHDRSKHINTRFHFIRDCIDEGQIVLEFVESGRQLADILTKPLGRLQFMELRIKIGMVGNKQEQQD